MNKIVVLIGLIWALTGAEKASAQIKQAPAQYINLLGESTFPEGIITLPTNELLVGGFGDGSLQKIDINNKVSFFS